MRVCMLARKRVLVLILIGNGRQLNEKLRQRQLYLANPQRSRDRGTRGTVAYLFRIDPFGNIHNLSAHESRLIVHIALVRCWPQKAK